LEYSDTVEETGTCGFAFGIEVWNVWTRRSIEGLLHIGGGGDMHIRGCVRMVMGSPRLAGSQRDLSSGDPFGGAINHRLNESSLHLRHRAGILGDALPLQIRNISLLRWMGGRHDSLRLLLSP